MKKILFLFALMYCISCVNEKTHTIHPKPKYRVGDIVYMKPDSIKATIYYYGGNDWNPCYALRYTDKNGVIRDTGMGWANRLISESELF